jgi:hypothetical protein
MKTRIFKSICLVALILVSLPMVAGDYLTIHFKDGHTERHFMHLVENIGVTKYDLEGNLHSDYQMQQIVMADTTYSYYLSDIESMSFKKVDDDEVQENATKVANTIEPIFSQCESIEDLERHLDEIKNIEGVENVYSTGTDIVVQVKDWYNIVYNYFLRQEEPLEIHNAKELASRLKKKANTVNSSNSTSPKVAIAFQQVDDLSQQWGLDLIIDLKENFERKGFSVTVIADEEKGDEKLDADFYLTRMFDYDMVLLITHGLSLGGKHALYTGKGANAFGGTFLTIENYARQDLDEYGIAGCYVASERRSDGTYKTKLKYYWYVSEDLIKKSSAKFKGPGPHIIFIDACEQLKGKEKNITFDDGQTEYYGDSFAQVLFDKGADYIVGYNKKALRGTNASNNFYRNMLNGFSLEASLAYLPEIQKKEITVVSDEEAKGARLIGLMNPNADENTLGKYFLFKTKTEQVSETYKSGNAVVSGTATTEYPITKGGSPMESSHLVSKKENGYGGTPIKLRCGFRHGLDPNLSKDYQETYCENPDIEEKTIDNVHFSCNIALPPICGTYYYQAFTYDGMNYNYGKICSIEIPEQPADEKQVMLTQNVGGTTYEIYKINTDKNDYHINPDGWKCYKSSLMLDMTKNGKTSTYTLDDNIYLDSSESHHGGQRPCLYLSSSSDQLFVFINSKDSRNNYTMDGYAYRTSLSNVSFTRETVFTGRNWGWSPYFTYSDGVLSVQHFSYAGYYAMTSYRNSDGTWTTKQGNYIKPDAFNEQSEQAGNVLIDDNPGLALSQTQLSIVAGGSTTVEITSGSGEYGVTNLNSSIARGTLQGTTVTIDGVAVGNDAKIVVTDMQTGQQIIITVSVTASSGTETPGEAIDLGLPSGLKWASMNVGASSPEDYGDYFAWGEVTPQSDNAYSLESYKWCNGSDKTLTKYCNNSSYGYNGYTDTKTVLDAEDDAATANWGGDWRMPTSADFDELLANTTSEWTTQNGVKGRKFTSKTNGNSIFLPAAGYRLDGELYSAGSLGYYWSSTLNEGDPYGARRLYFGSGNVSAHSHYRYYGPSVRPVRKN